MPRIISTSVVLSSLVLLGTSQFGYSQPGMGPPEVTIVACDTAGADADYTETLSGTGTTQERIVGTTSGCPNHYSSPVGENPNDAGANEVSSTIPAYPMLIDDLGTGTSLSTKAGHIGLALNGVAIYGPYAGMIEVVDYEDSAYFFEADTFDLCGGHSDPAGTYHYHSTPGCLEEQLRDLNGVGSNDHSPQVAWAYDGFPIYGQLGPGGVEMIVCSNEGAHETYCLDSCMGYKGALPDVDNFLYRYYLACGGETHFPHAPFFFAGCCPSGMTCTDPDIEACTDEAVVGYSTDYAPVALDGVTLEYDSDYITGVDLERVGLDALNCSLLLGGTSVNIADAVTLAPTLLVNGTLVGTPAPSSVLNTTAPASTLSPSATPNATPSPTPSPTVEGSPTTESPATTEEANSSAGGRYTLSIGNTVALISFGAIIFSSQIISM